MTIASILADITAAHHLAKSQLLGPATRDPHIMAAQQDAIWRLRYDGKYSWRKIAALFTRTRQSVKATYRRLEQRKGHVRERGDDGRKLTGAQVAEIKSRMSGRYYYGLHADIARQYQVSPTTISQIKAGRRWGDVGL